MEDILAALPTGISDGLRVHLENVARNLQFVADLGYGDVALAVRASDGALAVVADARPMTAVAAVATTRVGKRLSAHDEPEAYGVLETGAVVAGERRRSTRGIQYVTSAHPIGDPVYAVVLRDLTQQVVDAPGTMERQFMALAEDLLEVLRVGPLVTVGTREPFSTTRRAGDGVMRIGEEGRVVYASPNAVNILRLAGVEGALTGMQAVAMPGGVEAVGPVLASHGALQREVPVAGRVLLYRTIALRTGAAVLVEDITDARRRDAELKVKEATIREVHHRVKNNLQTISSLLRIQARRSTSIETQRSLEEAVERVGSMAVVHEMLSTSTDETVEFGAAARTVVDMVRQGLSGRSGDVTVGVEGTLGEVPASVATSLALVTAELVHNAIEHGLGERGAGHVMVSLRRFPDELHLSVRDDGRGLPDGFDLATSAQLGLAIVRTIVEDDLCGTLTFRSGRGTTVAIIVPIAE
ncbi:MAG TPA: histidine kinase N-terminal domain-containing protein [Coriobacteriia bacterium]